MCDSVKATLNLIKTDENDFIIKEGFMSIFDVAICEDNSVEFCFDDRYGGCYYDKFESKEAAIAYLDKIKAFIEAN